MFNRIKKWLGGKDIFLVQINYKSGNNIKVWMKELEYHFNNVDNKVSWDVAYATHKPLYMNVDEIESIYQIKYKVSFV